MRKKKISSFPAYHHAQLITTFYSECIAGTDTTQHSDIPRAAPCCSTELTWAYWATREGTTNLSGEWCFWEQTGLGRLCCVTTDKGEFYK